MRKLLAVGLCLISGWCHADASLTFGASTTDNVDLGFASSINNMDPFTVALWARPTTLTSGRGIYGKESSFLGGITLSDGVGNIKCARARGAGGGNNSIYQTNDAPLATTSKWYFICWTFSTVNSQSGHVYTGTQTLLASERAYATSQTGTGAVTGRDDSNTTMGFGNDRGSTPSASALALQGQVGPVLVFTKELSIGQCQNLQYTMMPMTDPQVSIQAGFNGTGTQRDLSGNGNNGTVNGATASSLGPPISVGGSPL